MRTEQKDDLIFPTLLRQIGQDAYRLPYPNETSNPIQNHITSSFGLTKRELFAAMAMQGIVHSEKDYISQIFDPNTHCAIGASEIAKISVELADTLLAELNKGKEATDE